MMEGGKIQPVIYSTVSGLENVPRAMEELISRKVWGKIVVEMPKTAKL